MKSFLYMDVDKINSIIAQAEKGITVNEKSEETNSKGKNFNASANIGAEGKAEFNILQMLNTGTNVEGKVGLEGEFEYNKVLRNITEKSDQEKIEAEVKENLNREQIRKNNNEIEKLKKQVVKNYEELEKLIKTFKNIVPYTKMLISHDGYLIPLEEKNFRVNPSTMGFMYNGEISCVGMITNLIGDDIDDSDDGNNIFGTIQKIINTALKTILPTKERNICIVNPIAIFYDN